MQEKNIAVKIGNYLKQLRISKKISAKKISEKTSYSPGHISGVETGKKGIPSVKFIEKYVKELSSNEDEYNNYLLEIESLSDNELDFNLNSHLTSENNSLISTFIPGDNPYRMVVKSPNSSLLAVENSDAPINDLYFHLNDFHNPKYFRRIKLNEDDKDYINDLIQNYIIRKLQIQIKETEYHYNNKQIDEDTYDMHTNELNTLIEKINNPTELSYWGLA